MNVILLIFPNEKNLIILSAYAIALIACMIWSLRIRKRSVSLWRNSAVKAAELSYYELAFLVGGGARVVQLLLVRLVKQGYLEQKQHLFRSVMVPTGKALSDRELEPEEHQFLQKLAGRETISFTDWKTLYAASATFLQACAARLAALGLKPTQEEIKSAGSRASLPFVILLVVGIIQICYGISQGHRVFYIVSLVILTFVLMLVFASRFPKITPQGENVLSEAQSLAQYQKSDVIYQVALFGALAVSADASCSWLAGPLAEVRHPQSSGDSGGGGGCGTSCGSSCGSGCGGGCGGGGD